MIAGVVSWVRGQMLVGIVLIVVDLFIEPSGVSVFSR